MPGAGGTEKVGCSPLERRAAARQGWRQVITARLEAGTNREGMTVVTLTGHYPEAVELKYRAPGLNWLDAALAAV